MRRTSIPFFTISPKTVRAMILDEVFVRTTESSTRSDRSSARQPAENAWQQRFREDRHRSCPFVRSWRLPAGADDRAASPSRPPSAICHYNFRSYSVGEAKTSRSPGRREIGHGALAKSFDSVLPPVEEFPYAIRVVSEVLSSNGSTSMGSTCGSCLALMDAGVPIKRPVARYRDGSDRKGQGGRLL